MLRGAIANLASAPEVQAAYLDTILAPLTGGGSAASYGNDELALGFEDYFVAVGHMKDAGEISQREIDAAKPLDAMLERWSGQSNADFWTREALFEDSRWREVRECARQVLEEFPDEVRESRSEPSG
jgi:hypothetical protein